MIFSSCRNMCGISTQKAGCLMQLILDLVDALIRKKWEECLHLDYGVLIPILHLGLAWDRLCMCLLMMRVFLLCHLSIPLSNTLPPKSIPSVPPLSHLPKELGALLMRPAQKSVHARLVCTFVNMSMRSCLAAGHQNKRSVFRCCLLHARNNDIYVKPQVSCTLEIWYLLCAISQERERAVARIRGTDVYIYVYSNITVATCRNAGSNSNMQKYLPSPISEYAVKVNRRRKYGCHQKQWH